jgi:hypothetical protein
MYGWIKNQACSIEALRWNSLDNRIGGGSSDDPAQLPARGRKQIAKLFFGALASAGENQHLQIEELARGEVVARLNDAVNDEELAARIHAFPAGFEYLDAAIVRPVMNDVFHDVSVGTRRDGGKHVAGRKGAAFHQRLQRSVFGSFKNVRQLVERASHALIFSQNGCEKKSMAASYVHDGMDAVKIVSIGDGGTIDHGSLRHGVVENLTFRRILLQIVEDVSAVDLFQRLLAGADAIFQM